MRVHVKMPHGCFVVEVTDPAVWTAVLLRFYMRKRPIQISPYVEGMEEAHETLSEADIIFLGMTDPHNSTRMREAWEMLGIEVPTP